MKLTAFKGEVRGLGAGAGGIFAPSDNLSMRAESGKFFAVHVPEETLRALHVGQTIVVSFETEEPIEAPVDIPAKATRAARYNVMLDRMLRSIEAQGIEWDVSVSVEGPELPARFIVTRPAAKRVVYVPEGQQEERVAELEALLTRIVKYAREDRAETPGGTRLARALAEAERMLARPDGGDRG